MEPYSNSSNATLPLRGDRACYLERTFTTLDSYGKNEGISEGLPAGPPPLCGDSLQRLRGRPESLPEPARNVRRSRRITPDGRKTPIGVFRKICGQNGGLVGHRQTHSVRVCSPPSRRVAPLRPRSAGLTAWTPAPRTRVRLLSDEDQSRRPHPGRRPGRRPVPNDRTRPPTAERIPLRNPRQLVLKHPSDAEGERDATQDYPESAA